MLNPRGALKHPINSIMTRTLSTNFAYVRIHSGITDTHRVVTLANSTTRTVTRTNGANRITLLVSSHLSYMLTTHRRNVTISNIRINRDSVPIRIYHGLLNPSTVINLSTHYRRVLRCIGATSVDLISCLNVNPLRRARAGHSYKHTTSNSVVAGDFRSLTTLRTTDPIPVIINNNIGATSLPRLGTANISNFFIIDTIYDISSPRTTTGRLISA